ncbi:MAG TPA: flagellin [Patescibacteria group bacterium]|nr:flagellin [Patescibacteria group bacterium]
MQIDNSGLLLSSYRENLAAMNKAQERIASGKKVNSAADNPAALVILQGMTSQINGLDQAYENTQNAISLLNTAEGGMSGSTDVLQRMRELNLQASNGVLTDEDRSYIQQEMNQLGAQLDSTAAATQFNGSSLLDGSLSGMVVQSGANQGQNLLAAIGNMSSAALGINADVSTQSAAAAGLESVDAGLQQVSSARSGVGALTNSLGFAADNAQQTSANLQAAASQLGDADIAAEATQYQQAKIQLYATVMMMSKTMDQQKNSLSLLM